MGLVNGCIRNPSALEGIRIGSISGVVLPANSGAKVSAFQNSVEKGADIIDPTDGSYKIENLLPGTYDLVVTAEGYFVNNLLKDIQVEAVKDSPNNNVTLYVRRNYFPLQVGNIWNYHEYPADSTYTIRIVDTTELEGTTYYRSLWGGVEILLRQDSYDQIIFRYTNYSNQDEIYFRLCASEGETWYILPPKSSKVVTLESRSDTVSVPVGFFSDCLVFNLHREDTPFTPQTQWWLAPNIGIIKIERFSVGGMNKVRNLKSATVNEVYYP